MVLSSVPATVLGALLLAARGHSLPHVTHDAQSGILRVPVELSKPDSSISNLAKRHLKAGMSPVNRPKMLVMNVRAGPSEANQQLSLMVDTGSQVTWTNAICKNADPYYKKFCEELTPYKTSGEPLGSPFPLHYAKGSATLVPHSAAIELGGTEVRGFHLGVATDSKIWALGLLGLGPTPAGGEQYSIVDALAKQNPDQSRAFSIDLAYNAKSEDGAKKVKNDFKIDAGSVMFGGVDLKRFSGTLETVKLKDFTGPYPKYLVNLDDLSFSLSGFPIPVGKNLEVMLDTGCTDHVFPPAIVNDIKEKLMGEVIHGSLLVLCEYAKLKGDIRYTFGKTKIVTEFADLIEPPFPNNRGLCHTRIVQGPADKVILGLPFFESAYTVFDQTNKEFHVAQADNCGSAPVKVANGGLTDEARNSQCLKTEDRA